MAGRKITQLPTLTTPAATDKLVIVDVSDTSESPQGTSKQIAVSNLGLSSIESTTLDVSIDDGVATVDGIGGDFTSSVVISNEADCTGNCLRALYSRVNNIVTCSFYLGISLDPTFTVGTFNVTLPVATNFANARDAFGVITPITDPYSELVSAITEADTANNELTITIELLTAADNITFVANIQYIILP